MAQVSTISILACGQRFARRLGMLIALSAYLAPTQTLAWQNNPCGAPFTAEAAVAIPGAPFPLSSLEISEARPSAAVPIRYIVVDLDTVGADGRCRGINERYPSLDDVSDFALLRRVAQARNVSLRDVSAWSDDEILASARSFLGAQAVSQLPRDRIGFEKRALFSYLHRVHPFSFRQAGRPESGQVNPVAKAGFHEGYCIGQRVHLCEMQPSGQARELAVFATSAAHGRYYPSGSGPPRTYYAPINFVNTRRWANQWGTYLDTDLYRDFDLGGAHVGRPADSREGARVLTYTNNGTAEMPAFVNFVPDRGYVGERGNGFHERSRAEITASQLGAPVSHGCIRLTNFASKFLRWWVPLGAKVFFAYHPGRYKLHAHPDGRPR